jgi:organic radical activating enzyme
VTNFKKLFNAYSNKTKFHLIISGGGEPTLWPDLAKFCTEIKKDHNVYITLVTNGSRTLRWWSEHTHAFDDLVLSCHHEEVDLDHFIQVADIMFENKVNVTALVLMSARHWDKCVSYIEQMKNSRHNWFIEAKPIVEAPGQGTDVYTPEQISYIDNSIKRLPDSEYLMSRLDEMRPHQSIAMFDDNSVVLAKSSTIIVNNWNQFKNWKCNVGIESISIPPSGKLFSSCGVDIFDKEINVFDENFHIETYPKTVVCPFDKCQCQPDTHVTKFKIL